MAFMVASAGQNKAFAQEFVTAGVNNEAAMQTLFDLANLPPAMLAVQENVENPDTALFAEAANLADPMPAIPEMAAVWEPLGQAFAAIVGGADPARTIRDTGDRSRSSNGN
jgi:arabinogalactan oligomer/maltooligosaccharide transport system substrate-binding protein